MSGSPSPVWRDGRAELSFVLAPLIHADRKESHMSTDLTYTDFALQALDAVLGPETPEQAAARQEAEDRARTAALGLAPWQGGVATKGCPRCKGTMKRTQERGGGGQWVCSNPSCGHIE